MTSVNGPSCVMCDCPALALTVAACLAGHMGTYGPGVKLGLRTFLAVGIAPAVVMSLVTAPAAQAADYSSFFRERVLVGAGWAACEEPVTWTVDVGGLSTGEARSEVGRLKKAWAAWSQASGIRVSYEGRESLVFDPATNGLRRADGSPISDRHVYLAFKSTRQVPIMVTDVVGLAMPSVVLLPTREIVAGMAIFRRDFVRRERKVKPYRVLHLYMHEIGHVLGLGHATKPSNVMYPALDHLSALGRGDVVGIRSLVQPCERAPGAYAVQIRDWQE
jgi:hypothetical protein